MMNVLIILIIVCYFECIYSSCIFHGNKKREKEKEQNYLACVISCNVVLELGQAFFGHGFDRILY